MTTTTTNDGDGDDDDDDDNGEDDDDDDDDDDDVFSSMLQEPCSQSTVLPSNALPNSHAVHCTSRHTPQV